VVAVRRRVVAGGRICGLDLVRMVVPGVVAVLRIQACRMGVGSIDGHDETAIYEALALVLNQRSPG